MNRILIRQQIIDWAIARDWKLDKWGHLQKTINNKQYRFKLSKIALRYEVKVSGSWLRLRSGYYKDLNIGNDNKLNELVR